MKENLDTLKDGLEHLGIIAADLTDEAIAAVRAAAEVRDAHLAQFRHASALGEVEAEARAIEEHLASERPWRDIGALEAALEAIRHRYVEERRHRLADQGARCENAKDRLRLCRGFSSLGAEDVARVFRPITEAGTDTTPEAVAPALVALRDEFSTRLAAAGREAEDLLDELLSRGSERIIRIEADQRLQLRHRGDLPAFVDCQSTSA